MDKMKNVDYNNKGEKNNDIDFDVDDEFNDIIHDNINDHFPDEEDARHARLQRHPIVWSTVGVLQTLLSSGVIFGWASLLPVLRLEQQQQYQQQYQQHQSYDSDSDINGGGNNGDLSSDDNVFSPEQFAVIFTVGAIGNYMTTLIFGLLLDNYGPKKTGAVASCLYAIGLIFCSFTQQYKCFSLGFFLIGFAGPGIQMPTLHLANLFPSRVSTTDKDNTESSTCDGGGSGGGALYMSLQAAAFDGGTCIFALVRLAYQASDGGFSVGSFFLLYLVVPIWTFVTALLVWPDKILPTPGQHGHDNILKNNQGVGSKRIVDESIYMSPYQSPSSRRSMRQNSTRQNNLINAPLQTTLRHPAFWSLAIWAGIHILKLNFVVATINDQLNLTIGSEDEEDNIDEVDGLIDLLGAILPFGFVVLPIVATLLDIAPIMAFELANFVGIAYGIVMTFVPGSKWLQTLIVFPSVACGRQLVYSTLFHQVGATFGFANYGVLLGLINVIVSFLTMVQTPLVNWSEQAGSYYWANLILLTITFPLIGTVFLSDPTKRYNLSIMGVGKKYSSNTTNNDRSTTKNSETTGLLPKDASFKYYNDDDGNDGEDSKSRSVLSLR
mmetsp:Transcript_8990/g.22687  ORF Transcript_8990/g.22687 Transcript_8990/m.22687 type:complete len:608 (+) Transcript_8990:436-2259(+)